MKRIISVLLAVVIMSSLSFVVPVSAAIDNSKYIPKIVGTDDGNRLVFDPELARIAHKMSLDAYGIEKGANVEKIAKTFDSENFVDIQQVNTYDASSKLSISKNFLVGVKTFDVNKTKKHVVAIAFRGTDLNVGGKDSLSDLITDAACWDYDGLHSGFRGFATQAYNTLCNIKFNSLNMTFKEYLKKCESSDDYYIFVTGHSLGAAVANILAGEILAKNDDVRVKTMCYTFASPQVCNPSKARFRYAYNIFNIINTEDIVPKVGYKLNKGVRFGTDLAVTVSNSSKSAHDLKVTYEKAMNQVINNISSMYKYTIPFYNRWCEEVLGGQDNNSVGTQKENNIEKNDGALGNSIVGVVDIPSSWENLSIRSGPSTNYQIVGSMNNGVRCNVYPSKTKNGWYYVEYNGIYGYASGNCINTGNTSASSAPAPTVKPSTPAGISLSTSNVNLNYPNSPTQTITVKATGDLPNTYKLELDMDGYVNFNWGTWSGNSINLTLTAHDGSNSCTPKIHLKDSNTGDVRATISFNVNVNVTKPAVKEYITVSFDSNGGSTDYASQTVEKYGTATIPSKKPSKSGYEFLGWSTYRDVSTASYKSGETINVGNTNLTFYAIWKKQINKNEWDLSLSEDKLFFEKNYGTGRSVVISFYEPDGMRENIDYHLRINIDGLTYSWEDEWYDENGYKNQELTIYTPTKETYDEEVSIELIEEDNNTVIDSESFYVYLTEKDTTTGKFADRNPSGISVYLNGRKLTFDVQPQIINSRTMVPMRKIFEELGTVVGWNNNTQKAISVKKGDVVSVSIGGQYLTVNGEQKLLDSPPVIISGRTLVPVRAVAESFNCDVEWYDYGASQVVDIIMKDTINSMENIGSLLIGYGEFPPFSFYDDYGNLIGFDTELAKYVCDFWGWECSFVEIPFDMKFVAINSGKIDCYWNGVAKTEEREEICSFTNDYISFDMEYEEDGEWYTSHEVYSVPFRKGDYDTVQLVNIALEEAQKDGTIEYLKYKYGIE